MLPAVLYWCETWCDIKGGAQNENRVLRRIFGLKEGGSVGRLEKTA
jgi:hypothetical protein